MRENERNNIEMKLEYILTAEEIHEGFREVIKKDYEFVREIKIGEDLCYMEVMTYEKSDTSGDQKKDIRLHTYMRKGRYVTDGPDHKRQINDSDETEIHVAYFDDEIALERNEACGGDILARYVDGKWKVL